MPVEREEKLDLEGGAFAPAVEVVQERIRGLVEHDRRVEPRAQPLGKRRLAQGQRAFDGQVAEVHGAASIEAASARSKRRRRAGRAVRATSQRRVRYDAACASTPTAAGRLRA